MENNSGTPSIWIDATNANHEVISSLFNGNNVVIPLNNQNITVVRSHECPDVECMNDHINIYFNIFIAALISEKVFLEGKGGVQDWNLTTSNSTVGSWTFRLNNVSFA
jgi:hypothetical protein